MAGCNRDDHTRWVLIPQGGRWVTEAGGGGIAETPWWGLTSVLNVLGTLSHRRMCTRPHWCVQHTRTHAITQRPRPGHVSVDFPPAAQRPWQSCPVHTVTYVNHMHAILHTWAPMQISVNRHRYWCRHYTHSHTLQTLLDLLRIRNTHSCRCTSGTHIHGAVTHVDSHMQTVPLISRCLSRRRQMQPQVHRLTHVQHVVHNCKLT